MTHGKKERSRVLVVDDEQLIALTLKEILEDAGYEVKTAFSGEKAVEEAQIFRPALLLTDVSMGAMSGIDAAVQITATQPECRVLFLSGHASKSDILRFLSPERLVYSVMSKPARVPDLLNAIAYMLPATITVSDPPVVEIEHDPMHLHSLARTALARLEARRTQKPDGPFQQPKHDRATGGTRQHSEKTDRQAAISANGEGWSQFRKPPIEKARRARPMVRATSLA